MQSKVRVCITCGKRYRPTGNRQQYCRNCGLAHRVDVATARWRRSEKRRCKRESMIEKHCGMCGSLFHSRYPQTRYCSDACRIQALKKRTDPVPCCICKNEFTPKRPGARVCPVCLLLANRHEAERIEAERRPITEPGPCNSCRDVDETRRGIAVCPHYGRRPCTEVNPGQDCAIRIPDDWTKRDRVQPITETLVRRNGRIEEVRR